MGVTLVLQGEMLSIVCLVGKSYGRIAHTHTHAHAHTQTHTHAHTHTRAYRTHTHTHTHTHTRTRTHTHMPTYRTCTHIRTHTRTHTHTLQELAVASPAQPREEYNFDPSLGVHDDDGQETDL